MVKRSPTTTSKLVIWMILWTLPTVMLCKTENTGARFLLMINKSRCKATSLREKKADYYLSSIRENAYKLSNFHYISLLLRSR